MAGRNKKEALDSFCRFFKESLSCVTDRFLQPIQISDNRFSLTYDPPVELLSEKDNPSLAVTHIFSMRPDATRRGYKTRTLQYSYVLRGEVGGVEREIVSYHWHPEDSAVRYPHLHVAAVPRVHFPTSRVSIEQFIRMLIDYFGVHPIVAESKWRAILEKNSAAFDKMATWK